MQTADYIKQLFTPTIANGRRPKVYNPLQSVAERKDAADVKIMVYSYDRAAVYEHRLNSIEETFAFKNSQGIRWINVDGIRKADVEAICRQFGIHSLLEEDILSVGQRPKMDEVDEVMYCLLNMLYFNEQTICVEQEQISIVLGKGFVITFQEDADRDVFKSLRDKLQIPNSRVRNAHADYLAYSLIDLIVDNYYLVMDKLSKCLEAVEEEIIHSADIRSLASTNKLRKELIVLRRNVLPVRDMINSIIRSDSNLLNDRVKRYFKDIYDHITQAADMVDNYRDMMMNMQDLYLNKANMRLNEVMKVLALVTCLMAPATVIGGIFGMNFDKIPYIHNQYGFWLAVSAMLLIPVYMLYLFKRRGWFRRM